MRANQLRLTFAAFAGVLMTLLRQVGLPGTALAGARADTIRARLLKVAARITVSRRRLRVAFTSVYPLQAVFAHVLATLCTATGQLTRKATPRFTKCRLVCIDIPVDDVPGEDDGSTRSKGT